MKPNHTKGRWYLNLIPSRPFIIILSLYLIGLLYYTGFRFFFYYNYLHLLTGEPTADIVKAFLLGFRFDQVVVLISLAPLVLVLPWFNLENKYTKLLYKIYLPVIFGLSFILLLVDNRFYSFFDSHLNFFAFEYIDQGSMFYDLILTDEYFISYILIWAVLLLIYIFIINKLLSQTFKLSHRYSYLSQTVFFILFGFLTFLGIRGRTSIAPIDWGLAYFSQNHAVNQLVLNGVYTLVRNLNEKDRDPRLVFKDPEDRFKFVDFKSGLKTVRRILNQENNHWLEPDKSLKRLISQESPSFGFKPNLIMVILEGWSGDDVGSLGNSQNLTPRFDQLASKGILFENFYAAGTRTSFGLGAILCSYPALPGRAIMKRYNAIHRFNTLSEILNERDYYNAFIYGGDLAFDNMGGFFNSKKFDYFFGEKDFKPEQLFSRWGAPDDVLFDRIIELADSLPRPFHISTLTLSNHKPFDLPDSSYWRFEGHDLISKMNNALIYSDYALGEFIEQIKSKPVFDSTVFVFCADHTQLGNSRGIVADNNYKIPFLIYAPALINNTPLRVEPYGGQVDLIPTLMSLIGSDYIYEGWGRNLFEVKDGGFAIVNYDNRIGYINKDFLYGESIGHYTTWYKRGGMEYTDLNNTDLIEFVKIQAKIHTYIQIADQLSLPEPE